MFTEISLENAIFLKNQYDINIEINPVNVLIIIWKKFIQLYYLFKEPINTHTYYTKVLNSVKAFKHLLFVCWRNEFNIPKIHCLEELAIQQLYFGKSTWFETSRHEAKNKHYRLSFKKSNKTNISFYIIKQEWIYNVLRELYSVQYIKTGINSYKHK